MTLTKRPSPRLRAAVVAAALCVTMLSAVACSESVAPEPVESGLAVVETPTPVRSLYSLSASSVQAFNESAPLLDAVAGPRWCAWENLWFEPTEGWCRQRRSQPPFGEVLLEDSDIRLLAGVGWAAPFVWSGPPSRGNPFPASGDFVVEFRMQVEQLGPMDQGLSLLEWNPAETVGSSSPFVNRIIQIWARSADGIRVMLPGQVVPVADPLAAHWYRLLYEDGAYTLFVDEEPVAGPIVSTQRPTALWLGNPGFLYSAADWSDIRVSQLTVTTPAEEAVAIPVAVKPGGCPSPLNLRSRGVLPVAIAGTSELDVAQIDASTLRLEGIPPAREKVGMEDVVAPAEPFTGKTAEDCSAEGPDGTTDLTVKFSTEALAEVLAGAEDGQVRTLVLSGNLLPEFGGTALIGEDVVVIRKK